MSNNDNEDKILALVMMSLSKAKRITDVIDTMSFEDEQLFGELLEKYLLAVDMCCKSSEAVLAKINEGMN